MKGDNNVTEWLNSNECVDIDFEKCGPWHIVGNHFDYEQGGSVTVSCGKLPI